MFFDLRNLRERKGFSQAEFAAALNEKWKETHPGDEKHFNVDMIIRMEKDPQKIALDVLGVIIQVFGVTFDQLLNPVIPRLKVPHVNNTWVRVEAIKHKLTIAIKDFVNESRDPNQISAVEQLKGLSAVAMRKAKIACVGRPDSGKSRTLNTLLGKDILPTNWTPTTSAFILLKHLNDRPEFVGNDTVFVFKDQDMEDVRPDDLMEMPTFDSWCMAKGDYELIKQYGAHDDDGDEALVGAIIVYVDSNILENCDLIDLPGFNPQAVLEKKQDPDEAEVDDIYDSRDSMLSARATRQADAFIYLSIANSFLYGDDLAMAQSIVKNLPMIEKKGENEVAPFGNLFFVASQALTIDHGDEDKLDEILDKAAKRVWRMVEEHPAIQSRHEQTGYEYTLDSLRKRFFTSEMERQHLTDKFYNDLTAFIEQLPLVQEKKLIEELDMFCKEQVARFCDNLAQSKLILDDHEAMARKLDELEKNEPTRSADFRQRVYRVTDIIHNMKSDSEKACSEIFDSVINSKHIVSIVDAHGLKKNRKDLQELVALLNAELENKLTAVLARKSNLLKADIDEFIKGCQVTFTKRETSSPDTGSIPFTFNVGRAFAGGLSGLATFGALAAWAATCGNLGGYVLVAKAVSLLASLGIHLGGTAAVMSAVSAIGGPVVLGIAIAVIAALTSILALGGTWKKMVGSKLVKQYQNKNILKSLATASDKFWDETMVAFRAGAEQIESDWKAHMDDYRDKVKNFDNDSLKNEIHKAEETVNFFEALTVQIHTESIA